MTERITPGIFVPADDGYLPAFYRAVEVATKLEQLGAGEKVQFKIVKFVRTASGMRRYQQDKGAIILSDGGEPLDSLTAVTNDIRGYEKLQDRNGNAYYVGQEQGRFVVRNPKDNSLMFETPNEQDAYVWLNKKVGGGSQNNENADTNPFDKLPTNKPTDSDARNNDREQLGEQNVDQGRLGRGYDISVAQAASIDTLTDDELQKYTELRQRGLDHREAYRQAQRPGLSGSPQAQAARAKAKK